jgi:rhamnosyl/mannosyltransferase
MGTRYQRGSRYREPVRVLQVFKDYYPPTRGGIEQHINDLVHSMPSVEFEVLTSSRSRRLVVDDDEGVRVTRAPEFARPTSTPITPAWRRLLRDPRFDVIHFHSPNPFGELMMLSTSTPPVVVTYHADIVGRRLTLPFFRPFQKMFLNSARTIIVSNPRLAEAASLARLSKRVRVIPFGIDASKWEQRPPQADELRDIHRPPLVLFVGRLAYYKGLDILIDAMEDVDATAVIVGTGPERSNLETRAASRRGRVLFTGEVPDQVRKAYLHAADVFVLPSTSKAETFGISALEAMASGTPVITTEVGTGTSWVNEDGLTGKVVRPSDPAALGGAIKEILLDETRAREMGAKASERVRTAFSKTTMLTDLESVYASALKG